MTYQCFKITQSISLIKKLHKIKNLINDSILERNKKISLIKINEEEKNKITRDLDKALSLFKTKYNIIHNKLYDIINIIIKCECCVRDDMICNGGIMCLKENDNEGIWKEMDYLIDKIGNFYNDVETKLILELELCLFRINKIKKIDYLSNSIYD